MVKDVVVCSPKLTYDDLLLDLKGRYVRDFGHLYPSALRERGLGGWIKLEVSVKWAHGETVHVQRTN